MVTTTPKVKSLIPSSLKKLVLTRNSSKHVNELSHNTNKPYDSSDIVARAKHSAALTRSFDNYSVSSTKGTSSVAGATEIVPVYVPEKPANAGVGGNWQLRWGPFERRPSEAVYDGFEYYRSKSISGPAKKKTYLHTGY